MDTHTRWGWGPVRGAYGPPGGHWKFFGFTRSWWTENSYRSAMWEFDLFNVFAIRHRRGSTVWAFASIALKFTRASFRYGRREEARERRKARRRHNRLMAELRAHRG